jgi:two-component system nitrogen regulation response regulator NtrX
MNKHLGYKEFEISALNSLRISNNIINIDVLDNIIFNLIKVSEGQKITSEDVESYLHGLKNNDNHKFISQQETSNMSDNIFNKPLKDAREEFEKLYFTFHMRKKLSVSDLAKKSGVERTHLYRKLKSLGVKNN